MDGVMTNKRISRANPQVWRLALWLHKNVSALGDFMWPNDAYRNGMYDKAKKLQYKLLNNAFTGPDNHKD